MKHIERSFYKRLDQLYEKKLYGVIKDVVKYTHGGYLEVLIKYYLGKKPRSLNELIILTDSTYKSIMQVISKMKKDKTIKQPYTLTE